MDSTVIKHFHSLETSTEHYRSTCSGSGTCLVCVLPELEVAHKLQEKCQQLLPVSLMYGVEGATLYCFISGYVVLIAGLG